jgi:penicillin-binding protein 1C
LRARLPVAIGIVAAAGVLAFWVAGPIAPHMPSFATVKAQWRPSESYLLDRHGELIDAVRVDHGVRRFDWTPLEAVSPALVDAVVAAEDRRFREHAGIDWIAVGGALRDAVTAQRRRGASTISMQVAGLVAPELRRPAAGRTLHRKIAQALAARALERTWSKDEILEAYFNLLTYRRELQGVGAASQVLAGKAPSGLSVPESFVLAALLPRPAATPESATARACARAAARKPSISCDVIRETAARLLARATGNASTPHLAPHVARVLAGMPGDRIVSTLDARVQRMAQAVLDRHLADLGGRNVRDGAVLVAENASGEVLAYVGSVGQGSRSPHVDGVRGYRQAGSTLKPFLYGLALERRYLTAASVLDDSPLHLDTVSGLYIPQNYDRDFKGPVSVRTALGNSLNVPAVRTLVLVGVEAFRDRLASLGYAGLTEDGSFYGFSLALGSAEVSLWEQVQAYRTLARGGTASPLRLTQGSTKSGETVALSRDASFVVADVLSDPAARAMTFGIDSHLDTPFWSAVKTGTSKDMRDNWCIGFSEAFTVGVWVGNFEGDSMHDVSGVAGAAPVWHDIMLALHAGRRSRPPRAPPALTNARIEFTAAHDAAREEWFLARTAASANVRVAAATPAARISSPANGVVIALDPDIPQQRQRVPLAAEHAARDTLFRLNGQVVGAARAGVLWSPRRGAHRLVLEDRGGRILDDVRFTVR